MYAIRSYYDFQQGMDSLLLEQLGRFITLLIPELARSCD